MKFKIFIILFFMAKSTFAFELKHLPVLDSGRIKPFDSMAREFILLMTGKKTFKNQDPSQTVLTWLLSPESWSTQSLIEINNFELKKKLKLNLDSNSFSYQEVTSKTELQNIFQELADIRSSNSKLNPYYQAVQRLNNQLSVFSAVIKGDYLPMIPESNPNSKDWKSPSKFTPDEVTLFTNLIKSELKKIENPQVTSEAINFYNSIKTQFTDKYPEKSLMEIEVQYNEIHFFKLAYLFYALSLVLVLILSQLEKNTWTQWLHPKLPVYIGLFLHTLGFLMRMYILKRPPVSNMYETVIWVSWGVLIFGLVIEKIYKFKYVVSISSAMAILGLLVADSSPTILDSGLHPLEPVLKSNLWLTIHVLVITISYSAFFLALGLGHFALILYTRPQDRRRQEVLETLVNAIYRAIQLGVALLAPGIILGGIWADYSWGRFWGWDPKETWALIVLLGYVTILHGRLIGWIRDFGMAVTSIVAFNLVIMAWYGVNFVLGAGLHTYGFGAGGIEYVVAFVLAEAIFVTYVSVLRRLDKLKFSKHFDR